MARLPGNKQLIDRHGRPIFSLREINNLPQAEKEEIYGTIIPPRLFQLLQVQRETLCSPDGKRLVKIIAPEGLSFMRIEVRRQPEDRDTVFFLEIADTHFHQMELSFCIINDPDAPRFDVDVTSDGRYNYFASLGRNMAEEVKAMEAGLFPNQTRHGLRMFSEFFPLFEQFVDSLDMEIIAAEPLTYDNAIRYERYGFDYITGRRLMREINEGFRPGGYLSRRMDGSTPFRRPGMQRTVRGRSWAIHDGILDESWDEVKIYKKVGVDAGINSFPEREREEERLS